MRYVCSALIMGVLLLVTGPVEAQFGFNTEKPSGASGERAHRWKVGMIILARSAPCAGIAATASVPTDWPEQDVKIVDEQVTDNVGRFRYRNIEGHVRLMTVTIARLNIGEKAEALVTFAITRRNVPLPDRATLRLPAKMPRDVRKFLAISPMIECRNVRIRNKAKELMSEQDGAWEKVEALCNWIKENVEHRNGTVKGAAQALRDRYGNHEDMASLFIALCRASKIPARTVWVPNYCYAEFYLEDEQGKGYWIPCELKEKTEFGAVSDLLPILQKGDAIRVPWKKEPQRFVAEHLEGKTGRGLGRPSVKCVRQLLAPE